MRGTHHSTSVRRVAIAGGVGTTIEFYDFFLYGTAAALVFPAVFFPALGDTAGTVASFATFAVAFVARPLGAVLFGHYGDRVGRKQTLITTMLLMGLATVAIGLLPTASAIGVAAPIILVVLRFLQGLAVGGEWAGAALLTAEHADPRRRGLLGVFPQLGPALAFGLSSGTFLLTSVLLGDRDDRFLTYGWRIPFLLSIVLVGFGLVVRRRVPETPVFANSAPSRRAPLREVVSAQPRTVFFGALAQVMPFAFFFMGTAYLTGYASGPSGPGLPRQTVLAVGAGVALLFGAVIAVSGAASDRLGRRRPIIAACVFSIVWAPFLFPVVNSGGRTAFTVALAVTLSIFAIAYGPVGSYLPELFATGRRYTGAGLTYNVAGMLGGAVPPLIAPALAAAYGTAAIGVMLAVTGALSLVAMLALPETAGRALDEPAVDISRPRLTVRR